MTSWVQPTHDTQRCWSGKTPLAELWITLSSLAISGTHTDSYLKESRKLAARINGPILSVSSCTECRFAFTCSVFDAAVTCGIMWYYRKLGWCQFICMLSNFKGYLDKTSVAYSCFFLFCSVVRWVLHIALFQTCTCILLAYDFIQSDLRFSTINCSWPVSPRAT